MSPRDDLRDYLAAERTPLAWIRTALSLMGFGFVVARFAIFLQQIQLAEHAPAVQTYGLSLWFGTALVAASVVVSLLSGWHHVQLMRTINAGSGSSPHSAALALSTCVFLAVVGVAMAIYLVSVSVSTNPRTEKSEEVSLATASSKEATVGGKGMISIPSHASVDQTVERLKNILQAKGVTLFAVVDHSGEAEKVGMKMPPTKLLIFGSPKAGTPLMLAAPSIAIDLPLKILVAEDSGGKVWISYNAPEYLKDRHGLPQELLQNISVVGTLAEKAGE